MPEQISNCSLDLTFQESIEVNNSPRFEESGSITIELQHTILISETPTNPDTLIISDIHGTLSSKTIKKDLLSLCTEEFTAHCVDTMLHFLKTDPGYINWLKTNIVSAVVHRAIQTKHRGLKHFNLKADIEITTTTRRTLVDQEMQSMEDLEWALNESMEVMSLKQNPASKSSIEKLKRDHFEGGVVKDCGVCLDDIEVGSMVIYMPCSHMFHVGCLLRWLDESNSCPLCRLELPV